MLQLRWDRVPSDTLGDVHVAGPQCAHVSSIGGRAGFSGPWAPVFLVWARLVPHILPSYVIVEISALSRPLCLPTWPLDPGPFRQALRRPLLLGRVLSGEDLPLRALPPGALAQARRYLTLAGISASKVMDLSPDPLS